ncbi:hypothetical protein BGX21_010610 [Mortierella sp. AD011]|nr:hypothetical protein BGX21_010610 [Mortierella sp. AD011]
MSNNVSAGETSHRGAVLPDSGADIPQHIKQTDRDQKFKLFECIQALMMGRLPTNDQLNQFLTLFQSSDALEPRLHMLSKDGRALYKDFQQLIQTTREIIEEKNREELFQNFIYHCTMATDTVPEAIDTSGPMKVTRKSVSADTARKDGQQILQNMKTVARLVTTNPEFRSILNEMFQLAMEVLRDSADIVAQGAHEISLNASQNASRNANRNLNPTAYQNATQDPNAVPYQNATQDPNAVPYQNATQDPNAVPYQNAAQNPNAAGYQNAAQNPDAAGYQNAAQNPDAAGYQNAAQNPDAAGYQNATQNPNAAPYEKVVPQNPDTTNTYQNVAPQNPDAANTYQNVAPRNPDATNTYQNVAQDPNAATSTAGFSNQGVEGFSNQGVEGFSNQGVEGSGIANQGIQNADGIGQGQAFNANQGSSNTGRGIFEGPRKKMSSLRDMRQHPRKDFAKRTASKLKNQFNRRNNETTAIIQAKTSEMQGIASDYASQVMTKERQQVIVDRLKLIVGQIQSDPEYQTTIDSIIELIGNWRQQAQDPASSVSAEAGKVVNDPNLSAAATEFKTILERWAQDYSLDPMIDLIKKLWQRGRQDPQLSQYLDNVSYFITLVVREPNYVTSDATIDRDVELLLDQGQTLFKAKYRLETDDLLSEVQAFMEKLTTDPMAQQVAENIQKVSNDLFYDKKGRLVFKPHLFDDFRYVILPSLRDAFQFIPIPRIEYSDLKIDLMLDNMTLTSTDLIPRLFEIQMNNSIRMVPRGKSKSSDTNKHEFLMLIQGVELSARHVDYYVKTKEGFLYKDRGVADVLIHRRGMDIRVEGRKTPSNEDDEDDYKTSMITFDKVQVKINSLNVKMRQSEHPVMNTFAQPLIKTTVKNAIAHTIEAELKEALISGDRAMATAVRDARIKTGKNTTSRVIFDADGFCVLDPVKHMELKVGQPLVEDQNEMANMEVNAPWVSSAFDIHGLQTNNSGTARNELPGMRRTHGTLAM